MNTRENNAAIARFLGWTEQTDPTERWFGCWKSEFNTYHKEIVDIAEKSKIGAAYNAVVEFIKWYNQNNK